MKPLLLILSFVLLFSSCTEPIKQNSEPISKGLSSPVYMERAETDINLGDYILEPKNIDSIASSKYYQFALSENKNIITLTPNKYFPPIQNLRLFVKGQSYDIPLFRSQKVKTRFNITKTKQQKSVAIKGQFVDWKTVPMVDKGTYWEFQTELEPATYQYLFVINGQEQLDPNNSMKISNGSGGFNSVYEIEDKSNKTPFLITDTENGDSFTITSENGIEKAFVYIGNELLSDKFIEKDLHHIKIRIPENKTKKNDIRVYAYNLFGRGNDVLIPINKGKVITNTHELSRTDFHTQIMYFLMVDRFLDGDKNNTKPVLGDSILPKANYMGGDLQGVIDKINSQYFSDLGINTIWLSPITQNPEGAYGYWPDPVTKFSGYHGYWPISNTKIDYRFGNKTIFSNLLEQAHKQDMNVLLDYVANHIHKEHPIYKEHPEWATDLYLPDGSMNTEKWEEHRLTTWFDTFLPTLDFSKKEVIEQMTDSAAYWVTEFELDGFRHDATKHIQQEFWRTLTKKVKKRSKRPVYQIGETYGSPQLIRSYINTGMLDAQFNFNLYDASVAVFAQDNEPLSRLSDALKESLHYYGSHHLMGNITGNQDRARFISYASGDVRFDEDAKKAGWTRTINLTDTTAYGKLEMLHAFNLTTPGIPCIYYGDEYGAIGANDPDNRRMMKFEGLQPNEIRLKNKVTILINLRKNSMALLYGSTKIKEQNNVMQITRQYFDEEVIVIFNKSHQEQHYKEAVIAPNSYLIVKNNSILN